MSDNATVILDALGGDRAPEEVVRGGVAAARQMEGDTVILAGPEPKIKDIIQEDGSPPANLEVVDAPEQIGMHETPVKALRSKKQSSIGVGIEKVSDGRADAFVSAGNTGAVVAASTLRLRLIEGVQKPGIAVPMMAIDHPVVAIDVGANVHCKASHLSQYALMADVFAQDILELEDPRVGLLNVGEEEGKGNKLAKDAYDLLQEAPVNFVGNVEARGVFSGECDIVVCDGFAGNVMLKTGEALMLKLLDWVKEQAEQSLKRKLGFALCREVFDDLKQRVDYAEYGSAPLLGVNGVALIAHGRSDARAIQNAVQEAGRCVRLDINERIAEAIGRGERN